MKNVLTLLVIASVLAVTGCKKDKNKAPTEDPAALTKAKIVGKWNFQSGTIITTNPPNPEKRENLTGRPGMYFYFRADGISFNNLEGDDEGPYTIKSASVIEIDGVSYTIKELTANRFVSESVYKNGNVTTSFNLILTR